MMKGLTHVAGAAVAAMIAMAAMPNEAAAVPVGEFGFGGTGQITFNGGSDIVAGITIKQYAGTVITQEGSGIFSGLNIGDTTGPASFDVPTGDNTPVSFSLTFAGFTFDFTSADLVNLTPTGSDPINPAGNFAAAYSGVVGAGSPSNVGDAVILTQSCDQATPGAVAACSNTLQTVAETTVPEPASVALLGSALLGFGLLRRRKA